MSKDSLVYKVLTFLKQQPKGKLLSYEHVADSIGERSKVDRVRNIIRRNDSPYFRSTVGGVKTFGQGSDKVKRARQAAVSQRRKFLSKVLEHAPQETMRPELRPEDGGLRLGGDDMLDEEIDRGMPNLHGQPKPPPPHKEPPQSPHIDLAV